MAVLFVARSAMLADWASDVGLGKHVYKVGVTDEAPKAVVQAGWAGLTDWALVRSREVDGLSEATVLERLCVKLKMVDPGIYPKLKGTSGVFKLTLAMIENHILIQKSLANAPNLALGKLKPADFGDFLIHNAVTDRSAGLG